MKSGNPHRRITWMKGGQEVAMASPAYQKTDHSLAHVPQSGEIWASDGCFVLVKSADDTRVEFDNPAKVGPLYQCKTDWFLRHFQPLPKE